MEARMFSLVSIFALSCLLSTGDSFAANSRTRNFVVTAPDPQLANAVATAAEKFRRELAIEWLGHEIEDWAAPCILTVSLDSRAFGETSFSFSTPPNVRSEPFDFVMKINGTRERLLDSVLPHEVTHTIFASHFGQPLPRWADEGACTVVEHLSERRKNHRMLIEFLTTKRGIPFNKMFAMKNYPRDILPLYAQGYSLCRYLVQRGGKRKLINFIGDGLQTSNWNSAVLKHYQVSDLSALQGNWLEWIKSGCPEPNEKNTQLVSTPVSSAAVNGKRMVANAEMPTPAKLGSKMVKVRPLPSQSNSRQGYQEQNGIPESKRDDASLSESLADRKVLAEGESVLPIQVRENQATQSGLPSKSVADMTNGGPSNFYLREIERAKSKTLYR